MKTKVDDRLRTEVRALSLRFTCESCASFDERDRSCAYGYPTAAHRAIDLDRAAEIVFCKSFELA
jgi:hypothetical protein